jgi:hypothetical protein
MLTNIFVRIKISLLTLMRVVGGVEGRDVVGLNRCGMEFLRRFLMKRVEWDPWKKI